VKKIPVNERIDVSALGAIWTVSLVPRSGFDFQKIEFVTPTGGVTVVGNKKLNILNKGGVK
jgi:hypothetical protein